MKCNVGDLILYRNPLTHQTYTGIITDIVINSDWYRGGFYKILWNYPRDFAGFNDDAAAFGIVHNWIDIKEATLYPVM